MYMYMLIYEYYQLRFQVSCGVFLYFRIHFPDPHSRYRGSQISIIGGLENVFDARQRIMVGRERENNTKHFI